MVILSEEAGIMVSSISVHFAELSSDSKRVKYVFSLLAKQNSLSVTIGLAEDDIPVMVFMVSHTFWGFLALKAFSKSSLHGVSVSECGTWGTCTLPVLLRDPGEVVHSEPIQG